MLNLFRLYFMPTGHLGQLGYWLAVGALLTVCVVGWPVLAAYTLLSALLLVYVFACLVAKRLRDIGLPGWLAVVPVLAAAGYVLLIGIFSVLTIGCCGAGSGGDPISRGIYRTLVGRNEFFVIAFPLVWLVAGLVPAPSRATADDPLVSPYI